MFDLSAGGSRYAAFEYAATERRLAWPMLELNDGVHPLVLIARPVAGALEISLRLAAAPKYLQSWERHPLVLFG